MEEEKIKEEILKDDIQNEILVSSGTDPSKAELVGEQKKKQWEKCVQGLARHRAIKKQQMEEEKKRKAEEKLQLKQKIREELEKQKLIDETKQEMEKCPKTEEVSMTKQEVPPDGYNEFEQFLLWKKAKENTTKIVRENSESDSESEERPKKKKKKKLKKVKVVVSSSSESDSEQDEEQYIPKTYYRKHELELEEEEERLARERMKKAKKLPPKANLSARVVEAPAVRQTDSQLLYTKQAPGKYFYI